jgi:purine-binding chemotaxis protein CheW
MNRPSNRNSRPQLALQSYLDALLQDITEELPPSNDERLEAQAVSPETAAEAVTNEFQAAVLEEQARDAAKAPHTPEPAVAQPALSDKPVTPLSRWAEPEPRVAPPLLLPSEPPLFELDEPDLQLELPVPEVTRAAEPVELSLASSPASVAPAPAESSLARVDALVDVHKSPTGAQVPASITDNKHNASTDGPPALGADGRPLWASEPFECLLFDVAGLTLAVPLVCLGSIYSLAGQELTPLFGQPEWFLGILPSLSGNLKVLDTARWVMPDRYRDDFKQGLQFVISVQGYEWGLAVHQVSRSLRLDPNEIKWRSQRGQRPWLAGTVIEHMCALLDVAALAELIASGGAKQMEAAAIQAAKAAAKPAARAKR